MKKLYQSFIFFMLIFILTSCQTDKYKYEVFPIVYKVPQVVIFNDETYTFEIDEILKAADIKRYKYEITFDQPYAQSFIELNKNTVKPIRNGMASLSIKIYDHGRKVYHLFQLGVVVSVVESELIEVRTPEDLKQMGVLNSGSYILKNDIDLAGIDYELIGPDHRGKVFSGMFINLGGYKIKNLTINSASHIHEENQSYLSVGLFGHVMSSFIYGIELENVTIDVSDLSGEVFASVGAIASHIENSIVINNKASGTLKGLNHTGGLYGNVNRSIIYNNSFEGSIYHDAIRMNYEYFIGGIVGYNTFSYIEKSSFKGSIFGDADYGGIVGHHIGTKDILVKNTFEGKYEDQDITTEFGTMDTNYFNREKHVEVIIKRSP